MPLIRIVDEGRNYVAAVLGEGTPLDPRPRTAVLATAFRCAEGWVVVPERGGAPAVLVPLKPEALLRLREMAAGLVEDTPEFRVERAPEAHPGDTDGQLLKGLRALGRRTSTCPCGYTYMDSCPNHD